MPGAPLGARDAAMETEGVMRMGGTMVCVQRRFGDAWMRERGISAQRSDKKRKKLARALYLPMTKKQATKHKPKRHQKASILTELLMDGAASEVFISGPNGFLYHRRPDGTITKREGIKR